MNSFRKAFTLIELLIVVAIIAILAAIAIPNFLEAQTRAKVSEVKSEMATIATGLEAFAVDNNRYPIVQSVLGDVTSRLEKLTTPISYLSSIPTEPFARRSITIFGKGSPQDPEGNNYVYQTANVGFGLPDNSPGALSRFSWSLTSGGPDLLLEFPYYAFDPIFIDDSPGPGPKNHRYVFFIYDPTNGTVSKGEIFRRGGAGRNSIPEVDGS